MSPHSSSSIPAETHGAPPPQRILLVDRLRGWVIVLMALDHARAFFQPSGVSPEDLANTTVPFFLMRWVTHLCAPTFLLLAGVSCWLVTRGRDASQLRGHLLKRGLVLMVLEMTWVSFSWTFGFSQTPLGVLWAIGGALVILSFLVGQSPKVVGGLGLGLTILLASCDVAAWHPVLDALCRPQGFAVRGHPFHSVYVIGPWFGVMAMGYGLAPWFTREGAGRGVATLGAGMVLGFVALRSVNGWGDPNPWIVQDGSSWRTALGFLNPSKYPPSLLFLMMTLGVVFLCTPLLSRMKGRLTNMVDTCGKTALFFYLIHLPVLHSAAWVFAQMRWGTARVPADQPVSYLLICSAWVGVCVLLTPLCRRWRTLKRTHGTRWPWMRYL